jgi:hypothetical protein
MDNGSGIRTLNGDTLFPQNSFCLDCEWGLSVFDVRHRFVASILYELPFGPQKPFLQDGVGGAILGGWQISAILTKSSGFPRTAYVGTDRSNSGGGQDRPDTTGLDPILPGDQQTINRWFNTDAYVVQPLGTWGTAGRNTFFGPGITNVDASIIRNFRLMAARPCSSGSRHSACSKSDLERSEHDVTTRSTARSTPPGNRCGSCSLV